MTYPAKYGVWVLKSHIVIPNKINGAVSPMTSIIFASISIISSLLFTGRIKVDPMLRKLCSMVVENI